MAGITCWDGELSILRYGSGCFVSATCDASPFGLPVAVEAVNHRNGIKACVYFAGELYPIYGRKCNRATTV